MKKLFIIVTIAVAILAIHAYSYAQNSIINNWNVSTINAYNSIVDSKSNPGDGIYTIEKNVIMVPYIDGGDTLYGTQDSCTFLKKFDFQGTFLWSIAFPTEIMFNGTIGEPGKIKMLPDGILLLHTWGISKYTFGGTQLFTTIYPQSSFDQYGFFGGGPNVDYFWNDVLQSDGSTITLGHLCSCDTAACHMTDYILYWISSTGTIVDSLIINRNAEMYFTQQNGSLYFAYLANGSIMIERIHLQTKAVNIVMNCLYAPFGTWEINKLISLHKTANGFRIVTSNLKDWDYEYNSTHTPTNYFVEVDTIANTMIADVYVQNNTKLKYCLDEWTSTVQVGDTIYVSTEDAKIIKWDGTHQVTVVDVLEPQEKIYGTARIALMGDKLLYVTNDSILTTIDSIVGNTTYFTEHKAVMIRVLDRNLNVLAQDTLEDYSISQFDLGAIDSTSFMFSTWWYTHPSLLSKWSFIENTTGVAEQKVKDSDIVLYPNPATDYFNISGVEEGTLVRIIDYAGRVVLEKSYQGKIDISGFAPGMYCVQIGNVIKKCIVQCYR